MFTLAWLLWIANAVFGVIEFFIGLRVILKLFAANPVAPFVNWVYGTSEPLIAPFQGMFPASQLTGGSIIEFSSLFALLVYAFIAYGIAELIRYLGYVADRDDAKGRRR